MNLRLYNARILTMEENKDIFRGEVWIRNDKIVYLGTQEEIERDWRGKDIPRIDWDFQLDCEDNLLMPGFKNAHTHSAMTLLRSYGDENVQAGGRKHGTVDAEKELTGEDIYHLTRLAILEHLTSGITAILDMYLKPDDAAAACLDMGMRCVLTSALSNTNSSIRQVEDQYSRWNRKNSLISYQLGCQGEYACDRRLLQELSGLAHRHRAPVFLHMAETEQEVKDCIAKNGMSPAMYMDSLGMFEYGGGAFHCVHMDRNDMDIFYRKRVYAITSPSSNVKLASGVAPIKEFLSRRVHVAIGTDGPGGGVGQDMFREMFLVTGLSHLREKDASSLKAERVLRMATVNGAKAMRLKDCDVLANGKKADIIMINLNKPNMHPLHDFKKNLVYSGSKTNVKMTMIGGRILYYDGKFHIGDSPEAIYDACDKIAERILKK